MATYDLTQTIPESIETGDILNCPYSGSMKSITLPAGTYQLQCWGAQGGAGYNNSGGKGGYAIGTLTIANTDTTVFLYSGGQGSKSQSSTIQGGGFNGGGNAWGQYNSRSAGGGGGASDIRIGTDSLYARVIVAGGGGGSAYYSSTYYGNGGAGGGTSGSNGTTNNSSSYKSGRGASQTAGGTSYDGTSSNSTSYGQTLATFGTGGSAGTGGVEAGGGGGWYGGGYSLRAGAGGGSGYVFNSSTESNYPSGCLLNSSHYLSNSSTSAGDTSFVGTGGSNETGHKGDGYVRITVIEVATIEGYYDITKNIPEEIVDGDILACPYSGTSQSITLPKGTYQLECWGAQGGSYGTATGGKGGYSVGLLTLNQEKTLYLYTGGKGADCTTTGLFSGGFNGGGDGVCVHVSMALGSSGGGASDIRIDSTSLYARVIVAGGGGGIGSAYDSGHQGGAGGGTTGVTGEQASTSYLSGTGGTQTTAGNSYQGDSSTLNNVSSAGYLPSFGTGGGGTGSSDPFSGGGGGWYGGGFSRGSGAGGGSGYVYTASTSSNYPSGCLLNSSYYLADASTIDGSTNGRSGNGLIKITVIEVKKGLPIRVKVNGSIKEVTQGFVKVGGTWKEITDVRKKMHDSWY